MHNILCHKIIIIIIIITIIINCFDISVKHWKEDPADKGFINIFMNLTCEKHAKTGQLNTSRPGRQQWYDCYYSSA